MNDDNKMGDSDKGLLDVEGKIRAKERKMVEVLRDRKEKTEKRKVKGGEGVAIDKGRKRKGSKEERGKGVEKDKVDGIEREDGREDQERKGKKGTYSEEDQEMEIGKGKGSETYKDKGKRKGKCKEILEKGKQEMKSVVDVETTAENGMSMTGTWPMSHSVFRILNILL